MLDERLHERFNSQPTGWLQVLIILTATEGASHCYQSVLTPYFLVPKPQGCQVLPIGLEANIELAMITVN